MPVSIANSGPGSSGTGGGGSRQQPAHSDPSQPDGHRPANACVLAIIENRAKEVSTGLGLDTYLAKLLAVQQGTLPATAHPSGPAQPGLTLPLCLCT